MIFIDTNVPMYLIGADHAHKVDAQRLLERLALKGDRLVTDAEVLQEILYRYRGLRRPEAIQPAFDLLAALTDEVFPIELRDVERARDVLLARWGLSARDAIHVAVMQRHGVRRILSFDRDFDDVPGIERIGSS